MVKARRLMVPGCIIAGRSLVIRRLHGPTRKNDGCSALTPELMAPELARFLHLGDR
jgi:hypothetical protein